MIESIAFGCIAVALLLNLWRLLVGPTLTDRILALDTMYINSIALILVYGVVRSTTLFFESGVVIALLGFVSTISVCKFLLRGDIIE